MFDFGFWVQGSGFGVGRVPGSRCRLSMRGGGRTRKVDIRLPGKGNSNSHGARPVHQIFSMMKWIQTNRLSPKNSLSDPPRETQTARQEHKSLARSKIWTWLFHIQGKSPWHVLSCSLLAWQRRGSSASLELTDCSQVDTLDLRYKSVNSGATKKQTHQTGEAT